MSKKIYLVDTENVNSFRWVPLLAELNEEDKVFLFYTQYSCGVRSLDDLRVCVEYEKHLVFVRCFNGSESSLDFQLSAVNGYLFHEDPAAEYIVISDDCGYDGMIQFMTGMGENIRRDGRSVKHFQVEPAVVDSAEPVANASAKKTEVPKETLRVRMNKNTPLLDKVAYALNVPMDGGVAADVAGIIEAAVDVKNSKIPKVSVVHNNLQKQYGKQGSLYYHALRKAGLLKKL